MATTTLLDSARQDQKTLDNASSKIRRANAQLGKAFAKWITVVGPELLAAREVLSSHGKGSWDQWCQSLGMSRQHVNRTIKAYAVVKQLEPVGSNLPTSERQCRTLAAVDAKLLPKAWELVTAQSEPITEASIKTTLSNDKRFSKFFVSKKAPATPVDRLAAAKAVLAKLSPEERQQLLSELTKAAA